MEHVQFAVECARQFGLRDLDAPAAIGLGREDHPHPTQSLRENFTMSLGVKGSLAGAVAASPTPAAAPSSAWADIGRFAA